VLLDLFTQEPQWATWSRARLAEVLDRGPVLINQIVYGKVAYRFSRIEALDEALTPDRFVRGNLPWAAARGARITAAHPGCGPLPHLLPNRRRHRPCLTRRDAGLALVP
jgi:hypothetical protein